MAIEPIGSIMSYQNQTLQQVSQNQKTSTEHTDVKTNEAVQVDPATLAVKSPEEKSKQDEGQQSQQNNQQTTNDQIKKAVEQMNKKMQNSEVLFGVHDETNRVTIKIVDKESKEVLKELPPEKTLDMLAKVWELAGLLVDERR